MVRQIKKTKAKKIKKLSLDKLSFVQEIFSFIEDNSRPILFFVAAILLIGLFLGGFWYVRSRSEKKAAERFYDTLSLYWQNEELSKTDGSKYPKLLEDFQSINSEFPNSKYARWSLVYAGNCCLRLKNYDKAVESYNQYVSKESEEESDLLRLGAYEGLGNAYIEEGRFSDAIKIYKDFIKNKKEPCIDKFLWSIGWCYEKIDDKKSAREFYKKILDDYPDSFYKNEAGKKVKILESAS